MREILFRGKRTDNGEWVDGFYTRVADVHYILSGIFDSLTNGIINTRGYKVIPETVGQYTGLTDKNGRKIFEGDIILYHHNVKKLVPCEDATQEEIQHYGLDHVTGLGLAYRPTRTIRYKGYVTIDNLWGLDLNLGNRCQWWRCKEGEQLMAVEVIGNIHDNPELLEGGEGNG